MHVAGKSLKLNPKVFNGKHGTVLDSGTTYAYFPKEAFIAIKDAVKYLKSCLYYFVSEYTSTCITITIHQTLRPYILLVSC